MDWKDVLVLLGVLVTLGLGIGNLVYNFRINHRTTFINTVTSERVKWIGKLRDNLSKFVGLTHHWLALRREASVEVTNIIEQINVLRYEIKLQLNPDGEHDKEIIQMVDEIPDLACKPDVTPVLARMATLLRTSQTLLKEEWEKVKLETRKGALADKPSVVGTSAFLLGTAAYLVIFGLIVAMAGAVWAARGIMIDKKVATELSSTKWDMNDEARRSLIRQSRDTRNGLILIAMGTLLQIVGTVAQSTTGRSANLTTRLPVLSVRKDEAD